MVAAYCQLAKSRVYRRNEDAREIFAYWQLAGSPPEAGAPLVTAKNWGESANLASYKNMIGETSWHLPDLTAEIGLEIKLKKSWI